MPVKSRNTKIIIVRLTVDLSLFIKAGAAKFILIITTLLLFEIIQQAKVTLCFFKTKKNVVFSIIPFD